MFTNNLNDSELLSPNIGLERGMVKLVPFKAEWSMYARNEIMNLVSVLKNITGGVEHIGSTSIPGMFAKPIIDIAIGLYRIGDWELCVAMLYKFNYFYYGNKKRCGGHILFKDYNGKSLYFLHIVPFDSYSWRTYLYLRNYLIENEQARNRYNELKMQLQEKYPENRRMYTKGKKQFIVELKKEAILWVKSRQTKCIAL